MDLACWVLEGKILHVGFREVWSAHRKTKGALKNHAPSSTPMFVPLSTSFQRILSPPFASVPTVLLRIGMT